MIYRTWIYLQVSIIIERKIVHAVIVGVGSIEVVVKSWEKQMQNRKKQKEYTKPQFVFLRLQSCLLHKRRNYILNVAIVSLARQQVLNLRPS